MLVTLPMARCATSVRSGSPPAGAGGRGARGLRLRLPGGAGAADVSSAVRIRPVSTSPAMKPSVTKVATRKRRLSMTVSLTGQRTSILRDGGGATFGR